MQKNLSFRLNGRPQKLTVDPERMLLWVLRTDLELTGAKHGCGQGFCGACTVLVDGEAVRSCQYPTGGIEGKEVITIEGLAPPGGIFASDTTHGVLGTARSELQDRGEFELKGIETPWRLYEVPCADEASTGVLPAGERTPYVGRSADRERLARQLEYAKDGKGSVVLIAGESDTPLLVTDPEASTLTSNVVGVESSSRT